MDNNAAEWDLILDSIRTTLERETEKAAGYIKNRSELFKRDQEREKQLKARYIDAYGPAVGLVLYRQHLEEA